MALLQFIVLTTAVAAVSAGVLTHPVEVNYDPDPHYTFGYEVQDPFTGDNKNQVETRQGDVVHGSYSLNDPDGVRRVVDYTADPINGFNAVVKRTPIVPKVPKVVLNSVEAKSFQHVPEYAKTLAYSLNRYPSFLYTYPGFYYNPFVTHYY